MLGNQACCFAGAGDSTAVAAGMKHACLDGPEGAVDSCGTDTLHLADIESNGQNCDEGSLTESVVLDLGKADEQMGVWVCPCTCYNLDLPCHTEPWSCFLDHEDDLVVCVHVAVPVLACLAGFVTLG